MPCDEFANRDCLISALPTLIKWQQATDLGETKMKAFVVAVLFAALSATGVAMLLNSMQEPGYVAFTTSGARVGDPGKNLIGPG